MKTLKSLTKYQQKILTWISKGYGPSASRRGYKAHQWREIQQLIEMKLIRKTDPTPWNRAGSFTNGTAMLDRTS